jgi:hypothetical protein
MISHPRFTVSLLTLFTLAASALAQPQTMLRPAKDGQLANLVRVPVPDARSVALSESLGLLAFCQGDKSLDGQVSLVKLDAKGNPAAFATTWKMPRPAALAKFANYGVSAAFHPKLPLLYVWQDITLPYNNPPPPVPAETQLFDHLCIYNVAKTPPELVVSLCRGPLFIYGMQGGGLAVDSAGEFLYVPNLRDLKNAGSFRFGRFRLDNAGLPVLEEKDAKLPAAARVKRLTEWNAAKGGVPPELTPQEYVYQFAFSFAGAGHSFYPLSRDVVIAGVWPALVSWRPGDKTATLHGLPLKKAGNMLLVPHPKLPLIYVTPAPSDSVFLVHHSDGYLSLLPHQYTFPDTYLTSPPAVLGKAGKLAVGGHHHVYVADLDDEGRVRPEVTRVRVLSPAVRALVYSPRFDKLYVGVEVSR